MVRSAHQRNVLRGGGPNVGNIQEILNVNVLVKLLFLSEDVD